MNFSSIDSLQSALRERNYIAERGLATSLYLALKLGRPLFLEGEAGVGKTEVAKILAALLDTELIRLQCYEGLDVHHAVYEWNYTRQMMHIRLLEARGEKANEAELFGPEFLLRRPLLQAIEQSKEKPPVLLIDELDRSDEEFEAFLLEVLSDFQITIPEIGTIKTPNPPVVGFCADCGGKMEVVKVPCTKCGAQLREGAKFCSECGTSQEKAKCANCQYELAPGAKFCPECGTKTEAA